MSYQIAHWHKQTNTDNTLGAEVNGIPFRFVETEEVRTNTNIHTGIEHTSIVRVLRSDSDLKEMRSGDDIIFASGEKRTVQQVRRYTIARGGVKFAYQIEIK